MPFPPGQRREWHVFPAANRKGKNSMILHCMRQATWEKRKDKELWGHRNIAADGFIHCTSPEYWWRIAPNFENESAALVIVCIDETKLHAEVRYEDGGDCGRLYPHIYGLVNRDAVTAVLPFLRDTQGRYIKNSELKEFADQ